MPSPSDLGQPKDFFLGSCCIERHLVLALPQTPKIAMGKPNGLGWFGAPFLQNLHLWIYHRFPCQKGPFWYPKRPFSEKNIETSQTPSLALLWPIFGTILSHLFALLLVVPGNLCELSSFHPGCDSTGSIGKQFVLRSASRGAGNTFYVAIYATNA